MRLLSMIQQQQVQGGYTPTIIVIAIGTITTAGVVAMINLVNSIIQQTTAGSVNRAEPSPTP